MPLAVGLDIGTSNTVPSYIQDEQAPQSIIIDDGLYVPSFVVVGSNRETYVGKTALTFWADVDSPGQCYRRFKLKMGASHVYEGTDVTPEWLTKELVNYVRKKLAGGGGVASLGAIDSLAVTVPHGWLRHSPEKRQATRKAVEEAGWPVTTLIDEPVAAAAYYSWRLAQEGSVNGSVSRRCLVCDMGGGTFDLSLVDVEPGSRIVVVDADNNEFAGDYSDTLLVAEFAKEFNKKNGTRLPESVPEILRALDDGKNVTVRNFMLRARKAKHEINTASEQSSRPPQDIKLKVRLEDDRDSELSYALSLLKLHELLEPLARQSASLVRLLLSRNSGAKLDYVVLAGGMSKLKWFRDIIAAVVGADIPVHGLGLNSDMAISYGAALIAAGRISVIEKLPQPVGIGALPSLRDVSEGKYKQSDVINTILVPKGTTIPTKVSPGASGLRFQVTRHQEEVRLPIIFDDRPLFKDCRDTAEWVIPLHPPPDEDLIVELELNIDDAGVLTLVPHCRDNSGVFRNVKWTGQILGRKSSFVRVMRPEDELPNGNGSSRRS